MQTAKDLIEQAVSNNTAKTLTLELAKALKGKKIVAKYFGYNGQDGVFGFEVGEIVSSYDLAAQRNIGDGFENQAKYWESYMTPLALEKTKTDLHLLDINGVDQSIICHTKIDNFFGEELTFTCSDADREVVFIEL